PLPSTHILSAANSVLTVPSSFHDLSTTQIYTFPTRRSSDLYRSHKRGVSSMSKEERKAPKLRFKGFSDDWEQRNISKIAIVNPKSKLPKKFKYIDLESVKDNSIMSFKEENVHTAPSRAQRVASKGDIFFQTVRPYQ